MRKEPIWWRNHAPWWLRAFVWNHLRTKRSVINWQAEMLRERYDRMQELHDMAYEFAVERNAAEVVCEVLAEYARTTEPLPNVVHNALCEWRDNLAPRRKLSGRVSP